MSTTSQILANRQNAQKSTGPKSTEGKAISAKNAVKHGLFSNETVIKGENQADFTLFREKLLDEFNPQGAVETMLAERIVSLGWRLKRIVRIQDQVFDVMIEKDEPSPYQKQLRSMMPKSMREDPRGAGPDLVLGRAAIHDFSNSRVLERLLMYERRLERSLNKTMDELHKRKLIRQLDQANKEIEADDFEIDEAITQRLAPGPAPGVNSSSPSFAGINPASSNYAGVNNTKHPASYNFTAVKNEKQTQSGVAFGYAGTGLQR